MSIVIATSADFNDLFGDQKELEVEIFHDGSIDFPDRDFQYEQAEAEFLPPGSVAVRFKKLWDENTMNAITKFLDIKQVDLARLATDWAEHVAHIFTKCVDTRGYGSEDLVGVLDEVRKFIETPFNEEIINELLKSKHVVSRLIDEHPQLPAKNVARSVKYAINASLRHTEHEAYMASFVALVAASQACVDGLSPVETEEEKTNRELQWQIRRFVDCMEAVGQDLPWPDMKVTP